LTKPVNANYKEETYNQRNNTKPDGDYNIRHALLEINDIRTSSRVVIPHFLTIPESGNNQPIAVENQND